MNQRLIIKEKSKITKSKIVKDLEQNQIFVYKGQIASAAIASINARYNHSNGKTALILVNKIEDSCFNHNQVLTMKKYRAEYDSKLGYWFISI